MSEPGGSAFAPLRRRAFLWLWLGVMVSSVGNWGQMVGAQWLFIDQPNAAAIVALVQTATTLPVMLLALPAGVLADAFDRRWMLFGVQVYAVIVSSSLAVLAFAGALPPVVLLGFTFAVGSGMAVMIATWQPLITELVPRKHLAAATRLDMVSVNAARAVGPAIAGVLIGWAGVPAVFAVNAGCAILLAAVLLAWRRPLTNVPQRERFLPALRAGGRYVRHDPVVRVILLRLVMFVVPASAMWALLPLIANRVLGLSASGYGVLFTALGLGAVAGALTLGKVKDRLSSNSVLTICASLFAVAVTLVMVSGAMWVALPLLFVAGYGWTATISTLVSELQLFLPGWVRARALAMYVMAFTGSQAIASPLWGLLAQASGVRVAVWISTAVVVTSALVGLGLRVPESGDLDRSPLAYWGEAPLLEESGQIGPITVRAEYDVSSEREADFVTAMQDLRRSRMRSGALRWELYRVAESPNRFVELFTVSSWEEHLRQHHTRLTAEDQQIERRVHALAAGPPATLHLVPPSARPRAEEGIHAPDAMQMDSVEMEVDGIER